MTVGDVSSLFQLVEELSNQAEAPVEDVENIARMARVFDFDGLATLAKRLDQGGGERGATA